MQLVDLPQDALDRLNQLKLERFKSFQFAVSIDGESFAETAFVGFSEVKGLGESIATRDVLEGGSKEPHKFPRGVQTETLMLTRGMTFNRSLYNWYQEVRNWGKGRPDYRRTLSVIMIDRLHKDGQNVPYEAWRWDIYGAWPSGWTGPRFAANSDEIAFESISIQFSGISQAKSLLSDAVADALSLFQ